MDIATRLTKAEELIKEINDELDAIIENLKQDEKSIEEMDKRLTQIEHELDKKEGGKK